ncbi:MAG: type II toxin-antitoxin system HicA family toxin [Spirochaetales bacterium]|nr:type II toxin-antitoxin system HicA family toxin [Spirochaetales bacterium]
MKSVSGKDFIRILKNKGWQFARISGSHHIFTKPGRIERISVPVHGNLSLKAGLLRHLMKIAEITEEDL